MTSKPEPADERLLHAHDLARAALREVTPDATIGDAAGYTVEEGGVVSLRFNNRLAGYPGWFWTVSLAVVEGADPTVLEVELLPGDGALLAPEWVPWAVRLADYQAAQAAQAAAAAEAGESPETDGELDDEDEDVDDLDDLDAADFDNDGSPILHGGDLDGVDIDELDDSGADDDDDADDEDRDDADEGDDAGDDGDDADEGDDAGDDADDADDSDDELNSAG